MHWVNGEPQRPPHAKPLSRQGAIARAAYRFCDGYNPELLPVYAAHIGGVDDFELTIELMREIALVEQEQRTENG